MLGCSQERGGPCFVAYFHCTCKGSVFWKQIFCILTFLKLFILSSQSLPIITCHFRGVQNMGCSHVRLEFFALHNLRWNMFIRVCVCEWTVLSEWPPHHKRGFSAAWQTFHTWRGRILLPGHPAVCGFWHNSLFQGNEIIYVFIHLFDIYLLLLRASQPWQLRCSWESYILHFLFSVCSWLT